VFKWFDILSHSVEFVYSGRMIHSIQSQALTLNRSRSYCLDD
jgi:hypothetical protein